MRVGIRTRVLKGVRGLIEWVKNLCLEVDVAKREGPANALILAGTK